MSGGQDPLVVEAQAGDRAALEKLLRQHQSQIHAVCRRITGNDDDALDATQDAMIAVVRGISGFDGRSRFSTWVYRIATNVCLDELHRRKRRPVPVDPAGTGTDGPGELNSASARDEAGADPAHLVATRLEVDEILSSLPLDFRVAVVLRDLCQLDYAEIAELLDVPIGTVRSRIARGRGIIADLIESPSGGNSDAPSQRPTSAP